MNTFELATDSFDMAKEVQDSVSMPTSQTSVRFDKIEKNSSLHGWGSSSEEEEKKTNIIVNVATSRNPSAMRDLAKHQKLVTDRLATTK